MFICYCACVSDANYDHRGYLYAHTAADDCRYMTYNYYIIYSLETEQKTVLNMIFMYKNSTIKTRKQDSKDKH